MTLTCDCEKFEPFIREIDSMTFLAYNHGHMYKSGMITYCPFCGRKLIDTNGERNE